MDMLAVSADDHHWKISPLVQFAEALCASFYAKLIAWLTN